MSSPLNFILGLQSLTACVCYVCALSCHGTHVVRRQLTGVGLFFHRVGSKDQVQIAQA